MMGIMGTHANTWCMTDNTKSRARPLKPFPASFTQAPAQRNKSDACAKAASELTLCRYTSTNQRRGKEAIEVMHRVSELPSRCFS